MIGVRRRLVEDFYSRPCGRGDFEALRDKIAERIFLLTPLREGRHTAVE